MSATQGTTKHAMDHFCSLPCCCRTQRDHRCPASGLATISVRRQEACARCASERLAEVQLPSRMEAWGAPQQRVSKPLKRHKLAASQKLHHVLLLLQAVACSRMRKGCFKASSTVMRRVSSGSSKHIA
eukprot:2573915-Amphidinium_carterae.1